MTPAHPIHNRTTDAIRTAYLASIEGRPALPPHDVASAALIAANCLDWQREAYRLLKARPDLTEYLERAAASMKVLQSRLAEMAAAGQGGAV